MEAGLDGKGIFNRRPISIPAAANAKLSAANADRIPLPCIEHALHRVGSARVPHACLARDNPHMTRERPVRFGMVLAIGRMFTDLSTLAD